MAADMVIKSLSRRIQNDDLMEAFQALQLPFWKDHVHSGGAERTSFRSTIKDMIDTLKAQYGFPSSTVDGLVIPPLVDPDALDEQFDFFYSRMKSTTKYESDTLLAWKNVFSNPPILKHMDSYGLLAQIMFCMPITSVENERQFSLMNLLKTAQRNRMDALLLNNLSRLKRCPYTIDSFPYQRWMSEWGKTRHYCIED